MSGLSDGILLPPSPDDTIFNAHDVSPENLSRMKCAFREHGAICVRIMDDARCRDLVLEQWRNVILKQQWTEDYQIKLTDPTLINVDNTSGRLDVDNPEHKQMFFDQVVGPLSCERRRAFEIGWPLHRGFGACCDPQVFHLPGVWDIRQDPFVHAIQSNLMGTRHLWVDINRSVQKLPNQGENEFLHFDHNVFALARRLAARANPFEEEEINALCGKVCYTRSRFVYVPGTHTTSFILDFAEKYEPLYPNVNPKDCKVGLSVTKLDPLNLLARKKEFTVPGGCIMIWNELLLHGQMKTPIGDPVEYGAYVGVRRAGSRPEYEQACGTDELEDRIRSYSEGNAPALWPSYDKIHFYPNKFNNFPKLLQVYINKLPPGHPMISTRQMRNGNFVQTLIPMAQPNYIPPFLTSLGAYFEWL